MPDFPQIGCRAVAQYPSSFELSFAVAVQRAVDGSEQRFLRPGRSQHTWRIQLANLRAQDARRVMDFFASLRGRATSFRFRDPWTGHWHEPCWFRSDTLLLTHLADDSLQGELLISTTEVS